MTFAQVPPQILVVQMLAVVLFAGLVLDGQLSRMDGGMLLVRDPPVETGSQLLVGAWSATGGCGRAMAMSMAENVGGDAAGSAGRPEAEEEPVLEQ